MISQETLLSQLRVHGRLAAARLLELLGISRPTMSRLIQAAGDAVIVRGKARRTTYAARRGLRGSNIPLRLYRVDQNGVGSEVGQIDLTYPEGCAVTFGSPCPWPLEDEMVDGWFDGVPYLLNDIRPQGFLGRQFAHRNAKLIQAPDDLAKWDDDDVLYALSLFGSDQPGNYILGDDAFQRFQENSLVPAQFVADDSVEEHYLHQAAQAMANGEPGSSAGGEFPKFTARRLIDDQPQHVIVKFSGDDGSPGSLRWADLLVSEHLASEVLRRELGIDTAQSRIYQAGGRTFLEVIRFDRHGEHGRSAICSWSSINYGLFGLTGDWVTGAKALAKAALLSPESVVTISRIWQFGRLISNTDMHDGNLSFRPGLQLAPVYDMLPMNYAPSRGVEIAEREYAPQPPLPRDMAIWMAAAKAAVVYWQEIARDLRVSPGFRLIASNNAAKLDTLQRHFDR